MAEEKHVLELSPTAIAELVNKATTAASVKEKELTKRLEIEVSARTTLQLQTITFQLRAIRWVCLLAFGIVGLVFIAYLLDKPGFGDFAETIAMGVLGFIGGLGYNRIGQRHQEKSKDE